MARTRKTNVAPIVEPDNPVATEAEPVPFANPHPEDLLEHSEEIDTRAAAGEALYTIYTDIRRRRREEA